MIDFIGTALKRLGSALTQSDRPADSAKASDAESRAPSQIELLRLDFDREKHLADVKLRKLDLAFRQQQDRRYVWNSPLVLAILAAAVGLTGNAVGLLGNVYTTTRNLEWQRELETSKARAQEEDSKRRTDEVIETAKRTTALEAEKAESSRILEALKTEGDPDAAAKNLELLRDAGLLDKYKPGIELYLDKRPGGQGASTRTGGTSSSQRLPVRPLTDERFCDEYLRYGAPSAVSPRLCRIGYAVGFNEKRRLADWLIYRLSASHTYGNVPRTTDEWNLDPDLPSNVQAGAPAYANNEYDRGSLIRRMDATWNAQAYGEIWFYTVTTPQHIDLNQRTWVALENATTLAVRQNKVRDITIYSGPIYGPGTLAGYREQVDIPDGFFRIAYDPAGKTVAAWVLPNGPIGDATYPGRDGVTDLKTRYLVTVDRIEELTRLDFFNRLPDDEEATLERSEVLPSWLQ